MFDNIKTFLKNAFAYFAIQETLSIFAVLNTFYISRMQGRLALDAGIFYACFRYWVYCTPSYLLNGNTAFVMSVLSRGKGNIPLFYLFVMLNENHHIQDQSKESSLVKTLVHETDTMSSLEIAELIGREHKSVMRSIRNMEPAWENVCGRKFALTSRKVQMPNGGFKDEDYYQLTKKECLYISTKFNDEARAKLVIRWESLETGKATPMYQVPQSFADALMLAAQQQKQIEEQQKQIAVLEEQTAYTRTILNSPSTVLVTQIAQDYGMGAKLFNAKLRDLKIQRKVGKQWILYAKYLKKGYVQSSTHEFTHKDGSKDVSLTTKWTQKGRMFLYNILKENGFLPLIEQPVLI